MRVESGVQGTEQDVGRGGVEELCEALELCGASEECGGCGGTCSGGTLVAVVVRNSVSLSTTTREKKHA